MKNYIILLFLIVGGIAVYTLFGILTFTPDKAEPFVFNEPTLPPEILAEQEDAALSDSEKQQQQVAVDETQKALNIYAAFQTRAPLPLQESLGLLNSRMTSFDLPAYFLSEPSANNAARSFDLLKLDATSVINAERGDSALDCAAKTPTATVIIGSGGADSMSCKKTRTLAGETREADIFFIGGPGNDTITDATGNRIINAGAGDDTITLGSGRSIIVLDSAWGHDTVTVDCARANVSPSDIPAGFAVPWIYKSTNFIVLGNGLESKDVAWNGNTLTNTTTGDSLTVNENCFTVVPQNR